MNYVQPALPSKAFYDSGGGDGHDDSVRGSARSVLPGSAREAGIDVMMDVNTTDQARFISRQAVADPSDRFYQHPHQQHQQQDYHQQQPQQDQPRLSRQSSFGPQQGDTLQSSRRDPSLVGDMKGSDINRGRVNAVHWANTPLANLTLEEQEMLVNQIHANFHAPSTSAGNAILSKSLKEVRIFFLLFRLPSIFLFTF